MACGVPFVQPSHGAVPELKHRTEAGLLTAPGDPVSLASALAAVADDPNLHATLSRNAHDNVRRHYSVRAMAESALEAYAQVLQPARPAVSA